MRWFYLVLLVILLTQMVEADSLVTVSAIKNRITLTEHAEFSITITNNAKQGQIYNLFSLQSGRGWSVDPFPLSDKVLEIKSGESYTTTVKARPLQNFEPGIYHVVLNIESDSGESISQPLKIYLGSGVPTEYLPSIGVTIDMDEKINPTKPVLIKLFLENRNPLDLEDLIVRIQSDLSEFNRETKIHLSPRERKTVEFGITPNYFQQPKEYLLYFVFEHKGENFKLEEKKIEIISLIPAFEYVISTEKVYLKQFVKLEVVNNGNVINTQEVKYPLNFWRSLFVQDAEERTEKGQRYLVWEVSLKPGEKMHLDFILNYRWIVYFLLAVLLLILFYFYARSPMVFTKEALTAKIDSEGALSEIKMTLELKNQANKPLKEIEVTDLVPAIANVEKSLELGTLKPKEIRHTKQGTKVIWSIAELDAFEHRLITYKLRAKLNILGTFVLPRGTVNYVTRRGRKRKAYSNTVRLG